ncbi:uncharacterized protein A1O5_11371 [Cladophialophora psammophila CBS 110553]|uniref:Zn(2)-C6 fungal-type domain-containing protein n=1 Tax=Cladophialophora psammophila CBS 110553 TaxID=1182543 RepID=W9WF39_9EURO|nr:uncharacterized protein A1O5_11371 [Cladophialophora psammophila CBS 110553]EXJ63610.1 hypothetical protein A1O5_11371 [Cladophialophora psammophila CBS 110553]
MTTIALIEDLPVMEKPKRTRKTHHKVRTGCITCKIRRKKCDEEKPFCRRCISTGRKCDGYVSQSPDQHSTSERSSPQCIEPDSKRQKTSADKVAIPAISGSKIKPANNKLCRSPSNVMFESDNDFFCFDFFRSRTGPEFAAYFDSSIWRTYILRACHQHPTVLAAAAAVGAVHRRFELGISREAFEYCDIADKLYHKALRKLSDDMASHPNAAEINMIVMKLFSIFETFQGNYDTAQMHMTAALKGLLSRKMRTTYKDTQYRAVEIGHDSLRRLFLRLELESVRLFGGAAKMLSDPEESMPAPYLSPFSPTERETESFPDPNPHIIPRAFDSLSEARDELFTEAKWIWHTWTLLEQGLLIGTGFQRHQTHISRLLQWSMAYAEYSKSEKCQSNPEDRHPAQLLKAYREAAYLLLLAQMAFHSPDTGEVIVPLCDPPETCDCHKSCRNYAERKEALNAHFARLLVLSEGILNRSSFFAYDEHSMSMDSGIGPPLYVGATHCRSTKVRHQVTSLLNKSEIQSRVWDTLGVYSIAEKISSIEEHAVVKCGAVADELEPKWVDITFFLDERRVLLRYCHADREGREGKLRGTGLWTGENRWQESGSGGLVWIQEWVAF